MAAVGDGRFNDVNGFSNRPPLPRQSVRWCWGKLEKFRAVLGSFTTVNSRGKATVDGKHRDSVDYRDFGLPRTVLKF